MKKQVLIFLLILVVMPLTSCVKDIRGSSDSNKIIRDFFCDGKYITNIKEETIHVDGVEGEYKFIYMSDLHIIIPDKNVNEADSETVNERYNTWAINTYGEKSMDIYDHLIKKINSADIDGVLMGGDMMDYLSEANWSYMNSGLNKLNKPYLFATADHDSQAYYTNYTKKEKKKLQKEMSQGLISTLEYEKFIILSINESTYQLTEPALEEINKIFQTGKPIIIVTHVPFDSNIDSELGEKSMKAWDGRKLLWGQGCNYQPDETTQKLIDMINDEHTPVIAVLAGHVHYEHICMINDHVKQYVFNPAYSGEIALFTVKDMY